MIDATRCQHDGCTEAAIGCRYVDTADDDLPDELLCHRHASAAGFCGL